MTDKAEAAHPDGQHDIHLLINGREVPGKASAYPVYNPVRPGEVVFMAPSATAEQLDLAVATTGRAAQAWRECSLDDRIERVTAATNAAMAAVEGQDLATLLTRENGKVLAESQMELMAPAGIAPAFAEMATGALADWSSADLGGNSRVCREPCGVVAAIIPFNWPVAVTAMKVIPALIAGNAIVVKPPPSCPGTVMKLVAAMAAELPEGLVSTVNGPGPELGRALVDHAGIDMVSFTGGVPTGRAVMTSAAARLRPSVLELGGNDAAVLAPDIEPDSALAEKLLRATFVTSGQVCMAIKRLYVPRARMDRYIEALVEATRQYTVGDGLAAQVTMGPLHTKRGQEFLEQLLQEAQSLGARIHRPASVRPEDSAGNGYLVSPAIVEGAPATSAIVREEQFAPALPVLPYDDLDEAVAQANDTPYGLCASIWSHDEELTGHIARQLHAGTVFCNGHGMDAMDFWAPFGGWKESGVGRELGSDGLLAYTRSRTITRHSLTNS